jgi:hypothetical protein
MLALPSDVLSDALDHPMIIQTIGLDPSRAIWTEGASNLSSLDPSGAVLVDAEHPTRNRKVIGRIPPLPPQLQIRAPLTFCDISLPCS